MERVQPSSRLLEIVLVDDDEQEISEIAIALQNVTTAIHLRVLRSGEEALEFLHPSDTNLSLLPQLILIEMDHRDCHGFDVLQDLKTHHELASIPVVLLTEEDHGVLPSYYEGMCSVMPKPMTSRKLQKALGLAVWN